MNMFLGQKPDRQQMQALMRCKLPENEALLGIFRARLEETKTLLISAEGTRLARLQGRAEALTQFLEAVEKSPEMFELVK